MPFNILPLVAMSSSPSLEGGGTMWETITTGSTSFINLITNVGSSAAENEIALAFLSVTFVGLAIRSLRKIVSAFGRGR